MFIYFHWICSLLNNGLFNLNYQYILPKNELILETQHNNENPITCDRYKIIIKI